MRGGSIIIHEGSSVAEVARWLYAVGLGEYAGRFAEQEMNGEAVVELERCRRSCYGAPHAAAAAAAASPPPPPPPVPDDDAAGVTLFALSLRQLGISRTGHVLRFCRYLCEACHAAATAAAAAEPHSP
jgi:hypothetical protein